MTDPWRHKQERLIQCTWFNAAKTIGSTDLFTNSFSCKIYPCVFWDHNSVDFSFELVNVNNHGPGIWQLSLDLVNDEVFCTNVIKIIRSHDSCRNFFPSLLHQCWDFLKELIKLAAINFNNEKQRLLHYYKIRSVNHLVLAKRKLLSCDDSVRKTIENHVSCIFNSSGPELTTQSDFYSELYKSNPVDLEIKQSFLGNLDKQLTTDQRKLCDEPLSRDKIMNALFTLVNFGLGFGQHS